MKFFLPYANAWVEGHFEITRSIQRTNFCASNTAFFHRIGWLLQAKQQEGNRRPSRHNA